MASTNKSYVLKRNGTAQTGRALASMDDDYVHIDENDYADWIVFAAQFAKHIRFYELNGNATGDWQPFFASDIAAQLGMLAVQDIDAYKRLTTTRLENIRKRIADLDSASLDISELFSIVLTLVKGLDESMTRLPADSSTRMLIHNLAATTLAPAFQKLLSYYKHADAAFALPSVGQGITVMNKKVRDAGQILNDGFTRTWQTDQALSWGDYYASLAADDTVFRVGTTDLQRIQYAASHNLFVNIFAQFLHSYSSVVTAATQQLLAVLTSYNLHAPQYALFLSFLNLFIHSRNQLNSLKKDHLDYYYRDILRFKLNPSMPGKAHIVVELAKHREDLLLASGTKFKGKKDANGQDIIFEADRDWLLNKARVAEMRSIYVASGNGDDDFGTADNDYRVYASLVSNSSDGLGGELDSASGEWHPFVSKSYLDGELTNINMPLATIGFAISSHYLYLTEGDRSIIIKLKTTAHAQLVNKIFRYYITTADGWFEIPSSQVDSIVSGSFATGGAVDSAVFSIRLTSLDPATADFDPLIHGEGYEAGLPAVRIELPNDAAQPYQYASLKSVQVTQVKIEVEVGDHGSYATNGVKQIEISGVAGPIDTSKPFQPFGGRPEKDATVVIGSREVFTKKNVSVWLNIEWANLPTSALSIRYTATPDNVEDLPGVKAAFLEGGNWKGDDTYQIFDGVVSGVRVAIPDFLTEASTQEYRRPYIPFSPAAKSGFLRLKLTQDFGYPSYLSQLTIHLINSAVAGNAIEFAGKEPYSPTIQSLYISYTATDTVDLTMPDQTIFGRRSIRFYHIHPFWNQEQHIAINGSSSQMLLPQLTWPENISSSAGEFHLGLEHLRPGGSVNILFQVLDGSSNPEVAKPEEHITWSYMRNGDWVDFSEDLVSDDTRQLIQSGIISFVIPSLATTDEPFDETSLFWIRATVTGSVEAIAKLVDVHAQAVLLHMVGNYSSDVYQAAMPAGSISKLHVPNAAIKTITQPYASFAQKAAETNEGFYVRVAERLRHKGRAVTIWDYERLVLQSFPDIHKVKCLNHTRIEDDYYDEHQPGYVSVITIPDLTNRNEVNPLRPYTNANRLVEIQEFLSKRVSCHVNVIVANPQFEEVRMEFALQLLPQYGDFNFYSRQLMQEITDFLTPWAAQNTPDIQFGGKIYKSTLINFIEEREYVDFITDVKMFHLLTAGATESGDMEEINASTARSILVSAPAARHTILDYAYT